VVEHRDSGDGVWHQACLLLARRKHVGGGKARVCAGTAFGEYQTGWQNAGRSALLASLTPTKWLAGMTATRRLKRRMAPSVKTQHGIDDIALNGEQAKTYQRENNRKKKIMAKSVIMA
jgi:hypothetical protein